MRVKTPSMIKALPVALAAFFAPVAASAITYDSFISFFGTPRSMQSYNPDGSYDTELFSFPNDGLNQAVRLRPMDFANHIRGFENEYTMDFFDIVGNDLFGQGWRDSIRISADNVFACAADQLLFVTPQFLVAVSYTDLMRTRTSLEDITVTYAAAFSENFNARVSNYSAAELTAMTRNWNAALIETLILPSIQHASNHVQTQHNITTRRADTPISISIDPVPSNISCSFGPAL